MKEVSFVVGGVGFILLVASGVFTVFGRTPFSVYWAKRLVKVGASLMLVSIAIGLFT